MTLLGKPHGPKDDNMTQILLAWAERDRDRTEWSRSKTKQSRTHSLTAWQKWHRSMETFVSLSLSVYKRVEPQRNGNFPQESYTDIFQKSQKGLSYSSNDCQTVSHEGTEPQKIMDQWWERPHLTRTAWGCISQGNQRTDSENQPQRCPLIHSPLTEKWQDVLFTSHASCRTSDWSRDTCLVSVMDVSPVLVISNSRLPVRGNEAMGFSLLPLPIPHWEPCRHRSASKKRNWKHPLTIKWCFFFFKVCLLVDFDLILVYCVHIIPPPATLPTASK